MQLSHAFGFLTAFGLWLAAMPCFAVESNSSDPFSPQARAKRDAELDHAIRIATDALKQNPADLNALSRRGDALFFRGHFSEAFGDYDAMRKIEPSIEKSHWRRGLAAYYAGKLETAAYQFEQCYREDDVDRENGIWRYFAQFKQVGRDAARRRLFSYSKDDRAPLPTIYELIQGRATADQVLKVAEKDNPDDERATMRSFYAHLYVGIIAALDGNRDLAERNLKAAAASRWAPSAGYGPRYMWYISLLEYDAVRAHKSVPTHPGAGTTRPSLSPSSKEQ